MSRWWLLLVSLSLTAACAAGPASTPDAGTPGAGTAGASAAHNDTSTPFNLVSLPALIRHRYDGRDLRVGAVVDEERRWTRHAVSYLSGELRITGQITRPRGAGPFPVVVLAHGYGKPSSYRSGQALDDVQAHLAERGYVVLLTDYRNYGGSDHDSAEPVEHPLGYPEDVVNAVVALRKADLPGVDADRVALLGRSMGGGVALAAAEARPELVDALVLYSSVSSRAADNYERWVAGNEPLDAKVLATYGAPGENARFWREASPRAYVGRVSMPVQVHHGTADPICPPEWSAATVAALRAAGASVEHYEYPGEQHSIEGGRPLLMRRVVRFLDAHV